MTGYTDLSDFLPTPGAFTTANGSLFVSKMNATGAAVDYTAVFAGSASDVAMAVAVGAPGGSRDCGIKLVFEFPDAKRFSIHRAGRDSCFRNQAERCGFRARELHGFIGAAHARPFNIPFALCIRTYTVTAATFIDGANVAGSTASLQITAH